MGRVAKDRSERAFRNYHDFKLKKFWHWCKVAIGNGAQVQKKTIIKFEHLDDVIDTRWNDQLDGHSTKSFWKNREKCHLQLANFEAPGRKNPSNTVFYSLEPRAEVYCLQQNLKISKLAHFQLQTSPRKMVSLGQTFQMPKTWGKRLYKNITVVLCEKHWKEHQIF